MHACYDFCRLHYDQRAALWPSVRRELGWVRAILPLLVGRLDGPWDGLVMASDSSLAGFGVCSRRLDPDTVGCWGRASERWRYDCEGTAQVLR